MTEQQVKVGIGVMIMNEEEQVLLGRRKGSHGEGQWAWPGGHMEHMESFEATARREIMEETGLEVGKVEFLRLYNLKEYAPKHYCDIGLKAEYIGGEPKAMEPEKCEGWEWFDINKIPENTFATIPSFVEAYKTGRNYFDA